MKWTNKNRFAAFDLVQFDKEGTPVGGERFEHRPTVVRPQSKQEGERIAQSNALLLYPNPTTGKLNIVAKGSRTGIGSVEVFDLQGKMLKRLVLPTGIISNNSIGIDISTLAPGLYLLLAKDTAGKTIDSLKFVKE